MPKSLRIAFALVLLLGCSSPKKPETLEEWMTAARQGGRGERRDAIHHLGGMREKAGPAVQVLAECLTDADLSIQLAAANALAFVGPAGKKAVPTLAKVLLEDGNWQVQCAAAVALNYVDREGKESVPALVEALKDSNHVVRTEAAGALRIIDPDAAAKAGVK